MSGGRLVVVDRAGRDGRRLALPAGLATLGRDPACDIRVMQPAVDRHHATVVVHAAQTVIRNVGEGTTLVNGRAVSVAALRHGDVITVGDRSLRWEYDEPRRPREPMLSLAPLPAARRGRGGAARARRGSAAAAAPARHRALQLALEMQHRASMPGSTGGKQVAIVQPQRRDTNDQTEKLPVRASPQSTSRRPKPDQSIQPTSLSTAESESKRKSSQRTSPKNLPTKATLWIESRKPSPRKNVSITPPPQAPPRGRKSAPAKKSTPLRLTVLKKAQSARKVVKIEAPLTIDHTKQAAIMLMTGHTPKSKLSISPKSKSTKSPSYLVKKPSPVRKTPRGKGRQSGRGSKGTGSNIGVTPSRGSSFGQDSSSRSSKRNSGNRSVTILEITDSTLNSTIRASNVSTRSGKSPRKSPSLTSPKKSAMKDHSKKGTRKTESIKFDLSNLPHDSYSTLSEDDLTLHYSESSNQSGNQSGSQSPSPRRSIHSRVSRSSQMLDKVGSPFTPRAATRSPALESPRSRDSIRSSTMVQKALGASSLSDRSGGSIASAFRTRTLTPRSTHNLESYSVVDLVSFDSSDATKSVYDSAASVDTTDFGTPGTGSVRRTRSTINPALVGSSTPYAGGRATRSKSSSNVTLNKTTGSVVSTRRSKSLSTPENKQISVNSTKISRASRSRSRINDSDLMLLDETEVEDSSPKTSKRSRATKSLTKDTSNANITESSPRNQGVTTPENRYSPEAAGTPVLSIQSLLNSSQSSLASHNSGGRKTYPGSKRKTIGVLSETKRRQDAMSKSLGSSVRKTWLRLSGDSGESDKTDEGVQPYEEIVTPKSAVKISPEAVKNKHSTAKKPLSKRAIIDDLNRSDIVKQLFNSPVKRKLSQSMTEFSRKRLFDDDDIVLAKRPTRNTVALTGRTPDNSLLEQSGSISPERFVSPMDTPGASPNQSRLSGLFRKTKENESRNASSRSSPRTPSARASIRKDLTTQVQAVIEKPPRDRRSARVSGVKSLFRKSPENDLTDVRGVKRMFRRSPENDLRNVSGVKRTLRNAAPKNDLTDVRGVRRMFRQEKTKNYHDVSGIEELFNESDRSANKSEVLFDAIVGRPPIRAVYSKTFSTKPIPKRRTRRTRSLRNSIDAITNNVEEWLEQELQRRLHGETASKNATMKELQKLATDTVAGGQPIRLSRTRNSSYRGKSASDVYSAHTLPIKKRSLAEASLEKSRKLPHKGASLESSRLLNKKEASLESSTRLVNKKEASLDKSSRRLPIKKRVVMHSTPVKGRAPAAMNASELGRVSPIVALVASDSASDTRSTQIITDEKPVKTRTPRKQETPKKIIISKPSPEKQSSPKRATRNRKTATVSKTSVKKRNSLVVPKKAPGMSPKSDLQAATVPKEVTPKVSPKKTRASRRTKDEKIETPKKTRARASKTTVVITKPSPRLKPQHKEKVAKTSPPKVEKPSRTRKTAAVEAKEESPKVVPKSNRRTRANAVEKEPKTKGRKTNVEIPVEVSEEKPAQTKRGRKTVEIDIEQPVLPKRGRRTNTADASIPKSAKTRGNKTAPIVESKMEEKQPRGRGKKLEKQESVQSEPPTTGRGRRAKPVEETQPKTRGKKVHFEAKPEEIVTSRRGRRVEAQTSISEPTTRSRRNKTDDTVATETKGRKRKAAATEEIPSKVAKPESKRGKKADTVTETKQKRATKGSNVEIDQQEVVKPTRGARTKKSEDVKNSVVIETKPVRGRKVPEQKEKVAETARGKRKANVEPSPAKEAKKRATKASTAAPPPPAARTRPSRQTTLTEVTTKAVGRSRRR